MWVKTSVETLSYSQMSLRDEPIRLVAPMRETAFQGAGGARRRGDSRSMAMGVMHPGTGCRNHACLREPSSGIPSGMRARAVAGPGVSPALTPDHARV